MDFNLTFLLSFTFLILHIGLGAPEFRSIIYNGFKSGYVSLDGVAVITPDGLLRLTNESKLVQGHAFYPDPIPFKQSANGSVLSFSTTFVFGIIAENNNSIGHGLVFIIAPTRGLPGAFAKEYLGLFNSTNNNSTSNHVVGVEMDTSQDQQFNDINDNHVGIDINGLDSIISQPAGYSINNTFNNIFLHSGDPIQVWIEYDALNKQMDVTLAPINMDRPTAPLLSLPDLDLSHIFNDTMYIGFSAATGSSVHNSHYILGWSFALNQTSPPLNISGLPNLLNPPKPSAPKPLYVTKIIIIGIPTIVALIIVISICTWVFYLVQQILRVIKCGLRWYKYKDLKVATKGFQVTELLGTGGSGNVYKGTLPKSKLEVAVKKMFHYSRQAIKEYEKEILANGPLCHRNLVQLLGYCRRKKELLLVYEYMPRGSLDKILHQNEEPHLTLNWEQRFNIIKGIASGLCYLHGECGRIVIHRDIKPSNVLLDTELNARVGDFGISRLHKPGDPPPPTTNPMGTFGYKAPEHLSEGTISQSIDVFSFGVLSLEVVCGRKPIILSEEDAMLVHMVFRRWKRGDIMKVVDPKLNGNYSEEKVEMVLKLGLLCLNVHPERRPTMREVVQYLDGVVAVPDLDGLELNFAGQ